MKAGIGLLIGAVLLVLADALGLLVCPWFGLLAAPAGWFLGYYGAKAAGRGLWA